MTAETKIVCLGILVAGATGCVRSLPETLAFMEETPLWSHRDTGTEVTEI